MTQAFCVVIPARFASTRFPGKPLQDIAGMPMIQRVWLQAQKSAAQQVVIATDDQRIFAACQSFGAQVVMTRDDHESGTDRLAEVVEQLGLPSDAIVVNVQGDEPLIDPELIAQTARQLASSGADIATVAHPIRDAADFFAPNIVKLVCQANGDALYFSRAPIPYARDHFALEGERHSLPAQFPAYRHIGLYAYRARFLRAYTRLPPAPQETFEALEQLRALWHGFRISVVISAHLPLPGVDTPEDARQMQQYFIHTPGN